MCSYYKEEFEIVKKDLEEDFLTETIDERFYRLFGHEPYSEMTNEDKKNLIKVFLLTYVC